MNIWTENELKKEYEESIKAQLKTYNPNHAWLDSKFPTPNYSGKQRLVVDFVRHDPNPTDYKKLDPRPKPWVVRLATKEELTNPHTTYQQLKEAVQVQILRVNEQRLQCETYKEAVEGLRTLYLELHKNSTQQGIDFLTPRFAECYKCGYTVKALAQNHYPSAPEAVAQGSPYVINITPLQPKDTVIHVC